MKLQCSLLAVFALVLDAPVSISAENPKADLVLQIVFFTPSDVEPPQEGVRERIKEYVDYSQMFYGKWMKHWGYASANPLPVDRDKNGFPKILYVKGRHTKASGRYELLNPFHSEIREETCRQYHLEPGWACDLVIRLWRAGQTWFSRRWR